MKLLQIILSLVLAWSVKAQATDTLILDQTYLATKTRTYTLTEKGLNGPGAILIKKAIQQSQFTILGEYHGSAQISNFTKALIPYLRAADYQHFACEIGPHSARRLIAIANPPAQTLRQLKAFNQQYAFPEIGDIPLPFFENQEDGAFLSEIKKYQMQIWGLDQEYFSAVFFLYDELLSLAAYKSNYSEIIALKERGVEEIKKWMIVDDESEEGIPVFEKILELPAVQSFFSVFTEQDSLALQIIEDLKISWDIYNRYKGGASHQDRLNYIRSNFLRAYQNASEQTVNPKFFVKIGRLHAPRNPIGGPDVGSLLQEIAKKNGTKSTHLSMMSRYYRVDGQLTDFLKTNPRRYNRYELFLAAAKPDHGLVIDLVSIRADLANGRVKYPNNTNRKYWQSLIENFDYQVVLPADYPATPAN
ncbi:MAG: hypothetical protein Sapg2KO_12620 [Saprospiraceae bacterium]